MPIVQRRPQPSLKTGGGEYGDEQQGGDRVRVPRWGRMTGASDDHHGDMGGARHRDHYRVLAARTSCVWRGVELAILAVIGCRWLRARLPGEPQALISARRHPGTGIGNLGVSASAGGYSPARLASARPCHSGSATITEVRRAHVGLASGLALAVRPAGSDPYSDITTKRTRPCWFAWSLWRARDPLRQARDQLPAPRSRAARCEAPLGPERRPVTWTARLGMSGGEAASFWADAPCKRTFVPLIVSERGVGDLGFPDLTSATI